MQPGSFRTSVIVAAVLATLMAGLGGLLAEVRWPGTSISSSACRDSDHGREDDWGRPSEACVEEDPDDEDDRELTSFAECPPLSPRDPEPAFLGSLERRPAGSMRPVITLGRGPPTAS